MNISEQSQQRYNLHQKQNKANELLSLMKERHSNRIFADAVVGDDIINGLAEMAKYTPSSCDRRAVRMRHIFDRDDKALLSGLLVGGTGFVHRIPHIFLLFADRASYKAGEPAGSEALYNPYLDAGCIIQQLYLGALSYGLHCCYINPQIRSRNIGHFNSNFAPWPDSIYCGAFGFGYPSEMNVEKKYDYDFEVLI